MISTNTGLDYSLDPGIHLSIPDGFTWPKDLKNLIATHEAAWNAWSSAELAQIAATDDLASAPARDKILLVAAVNQRKPDPGTPNQAEATRALMYAEETSRQAATAVNAAVAAVTDAVQKNRDDLINQAVVLERQSIAEYAAQIAQAQQIVTDAERLARTIGDRINWITNVAGEETNPTIATHNGNFIWPAPWEIGHVSALGALDRLDGNSVAEKVLGSK